MAIGDLATWVGGIGTVATLVFSLLLFHRDRRAREEATQEARRAQARLVAAWVEYNGKTTEGPETIVEAQAHLVNTSAQPVSKVLLLVGIDTDRLDPTPDSSVECAEHSRPALKPNTTDDIIGVYPRFVPFVTDLAAIMHEEALIIELMFTDSNGVSWVRTNEGLLLESTDPRWTDRIHMSLVERERSLAQGK